MKNPWRHLSKINPQKENGHRRISTEVYRALIKFDLTAAEYKICLCIIEHTWGYEKKEDILSAWTIAKETNLAIRTVRYSLKSLKEKRLIYYESSKRVQRGSPLNSYLFNKHYDTWIARPVNQLAPVQQMVARPVNQLAPTKDNITKERLSHKKCDAHPDHKKFIKFWHEEYRKQFSMKYSFNGGKDGKLVSQLLKDFEYDRLSKMTLAFFDSTDDWIKNNGGFTIGTFKGQANKLAQQLAKPGNGSKPQSHRLNLDDDPLSPKLTRTIEEIEA